MKTIKELKRMSFEEAYTHLQDEDRGNWDSVNSEDIIKQYCNEMMEEGVPISQLLEAIEKNPSSKELYCIWLGNSMETPTPINNVSDLIDALGVEDKSIKKFEVNFEKSFHLIVDVEAGNKEEAREKALLYFNDKTRDGLLEESQEGYFEHTYTDEVE